MKITKKHIQNKIDTLNKRLGLAREVWSKNKGVNTASVGTWYAEKQLAGWGLYQICNERGGAHEPFRLMTASELVLVIDGIMFGIYEATK